MVPLPRSSLSLFILLCFLSISDPVGAGYDVECVTRKIREFVGDGVQVPDPQEEKRAALEAEIQVLLETRREITSKSLLPKKLQGRQVSHIDKQLRDLRAEKNKLGRAFGASRGTGIEMPVSEYEKEITGFLEPKATAGTLAGERSGKYISLKESNEEKIQNAIDLEYENISAESMLAVGLDVEQNPSIPEIRSNPDYRINGRIFDHYAPRKSELAGLPTEKVLLTLNLIFKGVMSKITEGQTQRIVLRLDADFSDAHLELLRERFDAGGTYILLEVLVVRGKKIEHWGFKRASEGEDKQILTRVLPIRGPGTSPRTPSESEEYVGRLRQQLAGKQAVLGVYGRRERVAEIIQEMKSLQQELGSLKGRHWTSEGLKTYQQDADRIRDLNIKIQALGQEKNKILREQAVPAQ